MFHLAYFGNEYFPNDYFIHRLTVTPVKVCKVFHRPPKNCDRQVLESRSRAVSQSQPPRSTKKDTAIVVVIKKH